MGTLIVGFSDEQRLLSGSQSWTGKAFEDIKNVFDLSQLNKDLIVAAYGYYSKAVDKHKPVKILKIANIFIKEDSITMYYSVGEEYLITSESLKSKAQKILRADKVVEQNNYLPFCSILNNYQSERLFSDNSLNDKVSEFIKQSDWLSIYNLFDPFLDISKNQIIWNDADLLSNISFATAKLSEVYINLKHTFNKDDDKFRFLGQQKKYRQFTELLRKRCVVLNPTNPTYYSNLGYTHYQYARELTQIGGRRDGKPLDEIDNAIKYLDKALEINPSRLNDLYRKGMMLTELYPKLSLFSRTRPEAEKYKEVNDKIQEGIDAFELVIKYYQAIPSEDVYNKKKYRKEYIKSCYDVARAYSDLISNNWDEVIYLLSLDHNINENDEVKYIPKDLENIEKAIKHIESCGINDNNDFVNNPIENFNLLEVAAYNGSVEGVYKLYCIAKYYFTKFWILSGYGQRPNEKSNEFRDKAELFYKQALEFNWSKEKERADKSFIAERLCRLYISKKQFEEAAKIIRPFIKNRTDYYVRYSYASALMLNGKYDEAKFQIKLAQENIQSNKEMWLGHFINACSDLRSNNLDSSKSNLQKAVNQAKTDGKFNIDSLLIVQGFISIKENNRTDASKFLEQALDLNPYRVSIQKRVPNWQPKGEKNK
jgi:hypothetical protein